LESLIKGNVSKKDSCKSMLGRDLSGIAPFACFSGSKTGNRLGLE
jgi:hypothetical protein